MQEISGCMDPVDPTYTLLTPIIKIYVFVRLFYRRDPFFLPLHAVPFPVLLLTAHYLPFSLPLISQSCYGTLVFALLPFHFHSLYVSIFNHMSSPERNPFYNLKDVFLMS